MKNDYCLFCDIDNKKKHNIIAENDLFYSRWDNFPVSDGHAEIVPKRHIASFFELTNEEVLQLYDLIKKTKEIIFKKFNPDGYNMGVNEGNAAGRTIDHLHVHLIPRYKGDVEKPQGGIRNVIPGKGIY
ncbi:MAG: HIT family protein [Patescibacteria group bacterium]|nr:HIT family protein [Patescibacteria group bacterium]MDD5554204.1 HIT family protein [Patescibacteria group bacterium]